MRLCSLIISSRLPALPAQMGMGGCLQKLQAEHKNEKMSPEMLCRDSLWKPQVSADAMEKRSHATTQKMCAKCTGLPLTPVSLFLSLVFSLHLHCWIFFSSHND